MLLQLEYKRGEAEAMIKQTLEAVPRVRDTETLLAEVYRLKEPGVRRRRERRRTDARASCWAARASRRAPRRAREPRWKKRSIGATLAPAHVRRVRRAADGRREPEDRDRRRARPRRGARARPVLRAAGLGQDDARGADRAASSARPFHVSSGPTLEKPKDLVGILTVARRRRRAVHRRDPPARAGRRRVPLSGDGGLPDRHRHGLAARTRRRSSCRSSASR